MSKLVSWSLIRSSSCSRVPREPLFAAFLTPHRPAELGIEQEMPHRGSRFLELKRREDSSSGWGFFLGISGAVI